MPYHYHVSDQWPYVVGGFKGPLGTAGLGDLDTCDATQTSNGPGGKNGGGKKGPPGGKGGPPGGGPPPSK